MRTLLKTTISIIILLTLTTSLSASWYDTLSQTKQTKIDKLPLTDYNKQSGVAYTLKVLFNSKIYVNKYRVKQDACPQNSIRWKYLRDATTSEMANLNNPTECATKRGTHKPKPRTEKVSPPNPNLNTAKVQAWNKQSGAKETKRVLFNARIYTNKWWVDRHHCPKYAGAREIAWRVERGATKVELQTIYNPTTCENGAKPIVKSISIKLNGTKLAEDTQLTLKVVATNSDNSIIDITDKVKWSVKDSYIWSSRSNSILEIDKNILMAKREGTATIKAIYKNLTTQDVNITVHKEINGYILPPEPDETLNNSTLLGIDSNDNGVRDDVERWIFLDMEIYNGYEKIEQVIAMQEAKANQMALIDPTNKDDKVHKAMKAALDCWAWYSYSKSLPLDNGMMKFSRILVDKSFNTRERLKTYWQYDSTLAGRVFTSTATLKTKIQCEINIDEL